MPPKSSRTRKKVSTLTFANAAPTQTQTRKVSEFRPKVALTATEPVKPERKGKGKEANSSEQLWIDKYAPESIEELAVHNRKIQDVRHWLTEALDRAPNAKLHKYRRILVLTGPAGTGKTATLRALGPDMGFQLIEWQNGVDDNASALDYFDKESFSSKFQTFLNRASSYGTLSFENDDSTSSDTGVGKRQVILIEDIPPISHSSAREAFHSALRTFASNSSRHSCPLVLIVSDSGRRGEAKDERGGWGGTHDEVLDIRGLLPKDLFPSPFVTEIGFNPIAPTLLRKALTSLLDTHFSQPASSSSTQPSKEVINMIIESCNGDIRNAIMALQFACVIELPVASKTKGKASRSKKETGRKTREILEAITHREQSLALFHLLGRVLYNKRYGDPEDKESPPTTLIQQSYPSSSHLSPHNRRISKVDVNALCADSPIDASLFSLYIHQNYPNFCNDVSGQMEGLSEALSISDEFMSASDLRMHHPVLASYAFYSLAAGTLHSLPSPVLRRGQTMNKPEFFNSLSRLREAEDAREDVKRWLGPQNWSSQQVALEAGGILRAGDESLPGLPPTHTQFSQLQYVKSVEPTHGRQLRADATNLSDDEPPPERTSRAILAPEQDDGHGWLEDDDIDEL